MLSERGQTANDLIEACVDIEEMLVDWQLHALGPPANHDSAAGAAAAWVLPDASGFDVHHAEPPGRGGAAVMTIPHSGSTGMQVRTLGADAFADNQERDGAAQPSLRLTALGDLEPARPNDCRVRPSGAAEPLERCLAMRFFRAGYPSVEHPWRTGGLVSGYRPFTCPDVVRRAPRRPLWETLRDYPGVSTGR